MRKSEIKADKRYTDNKGGIREVLIRFRSGFRFSDRDWVKYRVIAKKRGPLTVGSVRKCTTSSFARWAKKKA